MGIYFELALATSQPAAMAEFCVTGNEKSFVFPQTRFIPSYFALYPNELGPLWLVVLLEVVGEHETNGIILWICQYRGEQSIVSVHITSRLSCVRLQNSASNTASPVAGVMAACGNKR